jgi:hypothetical protein
VFSHNACTYVAPADAKVGCDGASEAQGVLLRSRNARLHCDCALERVGIPGAAPTHFPSWTTRILTVGWLSPSMDTSKDTSKSYFGTRVLCKNTIFQSSACFSKNADSSHFWSIVPDESVIEPLFRYAIHALLPMTWTSASVTFHL